MIPLRIRKPHFALCTEELCAFERAGVSVLIIGRAFDAHTYEGKPCAWPYDVVISLSENFSECRGNRLTLSPADFLKHGTHAITFSKQSISILKSSDVEGERLWSQ